MRFSRMPGQVGTADGCHHRRRWGTTHKLRSSTFWAVNRRPLPVVAAQQHEFRSPPRRRAPSVPPLR